MRTLFIAVLVGLSGLGVGYWRYAEASRVSVESFQDPIEVMKAENASGVSAPVTEEKRARIEIVGGTVFDFGQMQSGTKRSHDFVFRNNGNGVCRLELGDTTCKCTIGELDNPELLPGDETKVNLTWTAANLLRDFSQTATIRMVGDPDQMEVKLVVKGLINNALGFEPNEVGVGDISSSDKVVRKVQLISCYEEPLEITQLKWSLPSSESKVKLSHVIRKLTPGDLPDRQDAKYVADITMEMDTGMPLGPLNGNILVRSNAVEEEMTLAVRGHIAGSVRIIGGLNYDDAKSLLTMGQVDPREKKAAKVSVGIKVEPGFEPKLEGVCVRPEGYLKVNILMEKATRLPNQWIIPVELEVPEGSGPLSMVGSNPSNFGKVEFRTNSEFSSVVPLYFTLEVSDR